MNASHEKIPPIASRLITAGKTLVNLSSHARRLTPEQPMSTRLITYARVIGVRLVAVGPAPGGFPWASPSGLLPCCPFILFGLYLQRRGRASCDVEQRPSRTRTSRRWCP